MFSQPIRARQNDQKKAAATQSFFQPKLIVNTPVDNVMRTCAECEKEKMQRKETGGGDAGGNAAPSIVSDVLSSGGGQAMESGTRQFMESHFGQDFSQVRIHTDARAAESASAIQARAYTSGRDVVFGGGEYQPGSEGGRRLLAHELVHVGQQSGLQNKVQRSIVIDGEPKPYIPTEEDKKTYGVVVTEMHNNGNPPENNFASKEAFYQALSIRSAQTKTMGELSTNNTCEFATDAKFSLPTAFWEYISELSAFKIKENVSPAKAVKEIFISSETSLDCNRMMVAIQYKSILENVGDDDKFNSMFPNGKNLVIGIHALPPNSTLHYQTESGEHPFFDQTLYEQLWVPNDIQIPNGDELKNLIPGDWVYFKNIKDYNDLNPGGPWSGEHAMYLGNKEFFGWGLTSKLEYASIIKDLHEHYEKAYIKKWKNEPISFLFTKQQQQEKLSNIPGIEQVPGIVMVYRANAENIKKLGQ